MGRGGGDAPFGGALVSWGERLARLEEQRALAACVGCVAHRAVVRHLASRSFCTYTTWECTWESLRLLALCVPLCPACVAVGLGPPRVAAASWVAQRSDTFHFV